MRVVKGIRRLALDSKASLQITTDTVVVVVKVWR